MTIEKKLLAIMEGKTELVEYHMKGTVNGKPFAACCDDVYSPDEILAQNPHLSADEAKAVHEHTETDNFIDGYAGTEGLHGGHLVKISSNGGYQGDKTEMQNKISKLSEETEDPYASNREEYALGFAKDWKTARTSKSSSGYKASQLFHTSELEPNHVYTYDNHGDDVYYGDNIRHFKVLSKNEDGSVTAHPVLPSSHEFALVPGTKPFTIKSGEIDGMPESNHYSTSSVYGLTKPKFESDKEDDEISDHRGNFNSSRNPFNESKKEMKDDAEGKADQVTDEPAVTIENPLDPALAGSDADDQNPQPEDEEEKIEESATRDHVIEKATDFFNKKHDANFSPKQIHDYLYNPNSRGEAAVLDFVNKKPELEDANASGEMHKHFGMSRSKFQNLLDFNESLNDGSYSASGETGGDSIQHGDWTITLHAKAGNNGASIVARHKDGGAKLNVFSGSAAQADSFFNHPSHLKKTVDILSGKVQEEVEELSEEFKEQARALFEAKLAEEVELAVAEKTAQFEATYTQKLEESVSEFERNLIEQIDGYFDILSEQWMRDNELALEAGTRSSLTESFMESIKKVFDAHYIDFPVEKIDIVESMEKTQDELKDEIVQLKLALDEKAQMLEDTKREIIMENATKGMTEIDAIKLKTLVEELGPTSNEELTKRLSSLKESVFGSGKKIEIDQSKLNLSSKPLVEDAEIKKPSETRVSKYADHIRKATTKRK